MVSNPYSVRTHSFSDSKQHETHSPCFTAAPSLAPLRTELAFRTLDFPTGAFGEIGVSHDKFHNARQALKISYRNLCEKNGDKEIRLLVHALEAFQHVDVHMFTPSPKLDEDHCVDSNEEFLGEEARDRIEQETRDRIEQETREMIQQAKRNAEKVQQAEKERVQQAARKKAEEERIKQAASEKALKAKGDSPLLPQEEVVEPDARPLAEEPGNEVSGTDKGDGTSQRRRICDPSPRDEGTDNVNVKAMNLIWNIYERAASLGPRTSNPWPKLNVVIKTYNTYNDSLKDEDVSLQEVLLDDYYDTMKALQTILEIPENTKILQDLLLSSDTAYDDLKNAVDAVCILKARRVAA
jgi:hypothetical protein